MKVILYEDIRGVGKKDQIINASDGYARNYLFPKKLACEATPDNLSKLKAKEDSKAYKKELEKQEAIKSASKINEITLKITVKAGENGKIFGGVSTKEIADSLKERYKIDVDKKKILLNESIKSLGMFIVDIKMYEGIVAKLKVSVIADSVH